MKQLLKIALPLPFIALLSGCSGEPENPAIFDSTEAEDIITATNGHWVHNPGACESTLETDGLYDLKMNDGIVQIGDSGKHWEASFSMYDSEPNELIAKITEWSQNCPTFDGDLESLKFIHVKRQFHDAVLAISDHNMFFMTDSVQWLTPFNADSLQSLPLKDTVKPSD